MGWGCGNKVQTGSLGKGCFFPIPFGVRRGYGSVGWDFGPTNPPTAPPYPCCFPQRGKGDREAHSPSFPLRRMVKKQPTAPPSPSPEGGRGMGKKQPTDPLTNWEFGKGLRQPNPLGEGGKRGCFQRRSSPFEGNGAMQPLLPPCPLRGIKLGLHSGAMLGNGGTKRSRVLA